MSGPEQLYHEAIRQHAANPVGYGGTIEATHRHEAFNPFCGDRILLQLRIIGGIIEATAFQGEACAICMASASLLCDEMTGRPSNSMMLWQNRLRQALLADRGGVEIGALAPLLGVRPYPARIQCAMLPWIAGTAAIADD
jgi:nitrogen fixation NifU-like protein